MSCQRCGHKREGDVQPHNYGCPESSAARRQRALLAKVVEADAKKLSRSECIEEEYSLEECAKDDCTEPRAVSKGPRPAKYCDEHRTARSK